MDFTPALVAGPALPGQAPMLSSRRPKDFGTAVTCGDAVSCQL